MRSGGRRRSYVTSNASELLQHTGLLPAVVRDLVTKQSILFSRSQKILDRMSPPVGF
ncbi:hypothetical protein SAMN05421823_11247 [Catalinimonas alkaloidigena]|uniref:Uncharacterized protein n=1 Tax=Catalinimonas alkaloidigena TaxID=1075417 RepID=A0A1G9S756_9BACT|nr:hypothetical protein SAMN05421823_11247 [Catalinimonas alkaloidigena]